MSSFCLSGQTRPIIKTLIDWLAEELAYSRGGSTLTSPFTGLYVSRSRGDVVRDVIHVLFCDFGLDADDPEHFLKLTSYLDEVRSLLMAALNEEDLWITLPPRHVRGRRVAVKRRFQIIAEPL